MPVPSPSTDPAPSPWALAHASDDRQKGRDLEPGHVEVELITDPWSVWCWGFEPVRRALDHRFPTIRFTALVGGMFEEVPDPERMGFDVERFFGVVQRTTGMPIRLDATRRDPPRSTYPACMHHAAVRLLRPDLATPYLRRLREAVYYDGRNVSRPEVAADVAESLGLDGGEFKEALASGEPEREFRETLGLLQAQDLHGYPTFIVRTRDRVARVEGFQTLPGLLGIVENLSGRMHAATDAPAADAVIAPGERVATREVAEVLGVSVEAAYDELMTLRHEGVLIRERRPHGDAWSRADTG